MNRDLEVRPYTSWQLIKTYWQSEQRFSASVFIVSILLLTVVLVGVDVVYTTWYNHFYTALQEYNKSAVKDLLCVFLFIAATNLVMKVYSFYMQNILGLRWRRWLTEQFLTRWMGKRSYYYLENFDKKTDNPDQRIQEDINSLVSYSLDLLINLTSSVTTVIAFIYILWKLSGVITIPIGNTVWHIPGYLVWVSVIYSIFGSVLTLKIGRPLVPLNFSQQRLEANFRYAAVDLRMHSENVALYRGEEHQKSILNHLLDKLLNNAYMIILRQKVLLWFTAGYNQASVLVPLAVALPNYFNKVFELGGLMQSMVAFDRVQGSLSFLVNAYTRIAEWQAVMERLLTFINHMYDVDQEAILNDHFKIRYIDQDKIVVRDVEIDTPQGQTLLADINLEFIHGQNYWLKGHSGIGKSTFVRAIAGIWPFGSGEITLPAQKNIMFIPQRYFMPMGTLKEALLFPDKVFDVEDATLVKYLQECGLQELAKQLNETQRWSDTLSPGELQRIAFVRVLVHHPDWVFLDESTSALDNENEKRFYEMLKKYLPNCSVVSVGHRQSLAEYHEHVIDMAEYSVSESALIGVDDWKRA